MFFEYITNALPINCIVHSLYSESKLSEIKLHREKEMIQQKEREWERLVWGVGRDGWLLVRRDGKESFEDNMEIGGAVQERC